MVSPVSIATAAAAVEIVQNEWFDDLRHLQIACQNGLSLATLSQKPMQGSLSSHVGNRVQMLIMAEYMIDI